MTANGRKRKFGPKISAIPESSRFRVDDSDRALGTSAGCAAEVRDHLLHRHAVRNVFAVKDDLVPE
jgi:hypothetical protein